MPKKTKLKIKLGFSLLELSVVILVVGILVFGVIQGGEIARKARVIAAASLTRSSIVGKMDGLALWYETTMPQSFKAVEAADGSTVSLWCDISNSNIFYSSAPCSSSTINTNSASQTTVTQQPVYTTNAINGLPALTFNNSTDYISVSNFNIVMNNIGSGGFAIFAVVSKTQSARGDFLNYKSGNGSYDFGLFIDASSHVNTWFYTSSGLIGTINVGSAAFNIITASRDNSSNYTEYVNGAQDLTAANILEDFGAYPAGTPLFIGSNHDSSGSFNPQGPFGGNIAEIIIFSRVLSAQETQDVETYLGKKWGITIL